MYHQMTSQKPIPTRKNTIYRTKKETVFEPESLANCKIVSYLANKGTGSNKNVSFDLFDNVTKIKEVNGFIHAVGINYLTNVSTVLILKVCKR